MKIHHATLKKAEDAGFTLEERQGGAVAVVCENNIIWGLHADPKEALTMALDNWNADTPFDSVTASARQIIPAKYRELYAQNNDRCGDDMSEILAAELVSHDEKGRPVLNTGAYQQVADDNGVDTSRWNHLNNGMRRMNLGNVLRGMVNKGTDIKIGTHTIKGTVAEDDGKQKAA